MSRASWSILFASAGLASHPDTAMYAWRNVSTLVTPPAQSITNWSNSANIVFSSITSSRPEINAISVLNPTTWEKTDRVKS
eukprot:422996-Prorocentrum_minimum.AAC.3